VNSESIVHNISRIVKECINATVSGSACYAPTPYTLPNTALLAAHIFIATVLGLGIIVAAIHLVYIYGYVKSHGRSRTWFANGSCAPCRLTAIIVPIKNEPIDVVLGAVRRFAELDEKDKAVLVLVSDDDKDYADELGNAVKAESERLGVNVVFLWRGGGGYKGSALNWALQRVDADCFIVADVDSVLPRDVIRRAWCAPPDGIAIFGIDGYSTIRNKFGESMEFLYRYLLKPSVLGKYVMGRPMLAYGSGGMAFRREFLDRIGWFCDCAAEDYDISMRAWLKGSGVVLVPGDPVLVEVPATYSAFRRQHFRWSSNGVFLIRKYLVSLIRSKLPPTYKLDLGIHMALHPLSMLVSALFVLSDFVTGAIGLLIPPLYILIPKAVLTAMLTANTLLVLKVAMHDGIGPIEALRRLIRASIIYSLISIPTVVRMVVEGLSGRIMWRPTPKGRSQLGYREIPIAEVSQILVFVLVAILATLYGIYTLAIVATWWTLVFTYALAIAARQ